MDNDDRRHEGPLTSSNSDSIRDKPVIYLDAVKVYCHLETTHSETYSVPLRPLDQLLFSQTRFKVNKAGTVYVTKALGTNGAFADRYENREYQYIGRNESNQLTEFEKERVIKKAGALAPWQIQKNQVLVPYGKLIEWMGMQLGSLTVFNPKLNECEFYFELPFFNIDRSFDDAFTKHLSVLFGCEPRRREEFSSRSQLEDGEYRVWPIETPSSLNKGAKVIVKAYEKGDFVRIEIRFLGVTCPNQLGFPAPYRIGVANLIATLNERISFLGQIAEQILAKINSCLLSNVPSFNLALFRNALLALGCRGVKSSKTYDTLFEALDKNGVYTPAQKLKHLRLPHATLEKLSDVSTGLLRKVGPVKGVPRVSYVLRDDWECRARANIERSNNSRFPIPPVYFEQAP